MFWADELIKERKGHEWVNDAWTPSGMVHMGGLKGPVLHQVLYQVIKERGQDGTFTFGFDDMDPIDGLPPELRKSHEQYMGVPICYAPSPDGNGSFGDYFGNRMRRYFQSLGIEATIYLASDYYTKGIYNDAIRFVLDNAEKVRQVYSTIYKKEVASDWFPLQVICPQCKKLGTTKVNAWNGKEVTFTCEPHLVKWAEGCGFSGTISPFDGNGKMPFKVEWAAKWWTFKVTIEGAGKDHASAGGTYDVARKICSDVFGQEPPLKLPYEFFLSGGKKMSSSKGVGMDADELLEVMPPQVVRLLMIKTSPNTAVEFSPYGTDDIPRLYDFYQKAADAYFNNGDSDLARIFELSQIGEVKRPPTVRFSVLAQWVQMPNMQEKIKEAQLEEWSKFAKIWIEKYAPESDKFLVQKETPEEAKNLSEQQKTFLKEVSMQLNKEWDPEAFQKQLYELAKEKGISSKDAFGAIYAALIGKNSGPKAGWLLLSLDRDFVKNRILEVVEIQQETKNVNQGQNGKALNRPEIFYIDKELQNKFPSISIGIAVIKNVSIKKTDPDLEKEKEELLKSIEDLTTEQLGQYPEILSYRKLYKEMGVDWHSRRPSPEALLRRVALKKGLYSVNTCVDAYNLVVMKHRISIGAFDEDTVKYPTILRLAQEGEEILLLGDIDSTKYTTKEIAYFDNDGGINMDFNYRDAQRTAVQLTTKNVYVNVDGVYDISPQKVEEVLKETCEIIIKYCGGTIEAFGVETV